MGVTTRYLLASLASLLIIVFVTFLIGTPFSAEFGRGIIAGAFGSWILVGAGLRLTLSRMIEKSHLAAPWLVVVSKDRIDKFDRDVKQGGNTGHFVYLKEDNWADLPANLAKKWAGVIVAWSGEVRRDLFALLLDSRFQGLTVISAEDFYERSLFKMPVYWLDQRLLMTAEGFGFFASPISHRLKRLVDLILVILISPFALILVAIGGLMIWFESGRPIFYSQERIGWDRQTFRIRKLRTMIQSAETDGAQWAQEKDPRITRVGHFLRKTRMDEFPQVWNILVGDMSFIGPRPERPEFSDHLEEVIPYYKLRYWVRPGLTGWAQVCYRYGASTEDAIEKLEFDLYYIKNYSLALDLSILIKTIRVVLLGAGR